MRKAIAIICFAAFAFVGANESLTNQAAAASTMLVTWFKAGQPPQSYQVKFRDGFLCANAATEVRLDAKRLAMKIEQDHWQDEEATNECNRLRGFSSVHSLTGPALPSASV